MAATWGREKSFSLFIFLNVTLMAAGEGMRSLHGWTSLFRSDASVHFQSDHQMSAAHNDYLFNIKHDKYAHSASRHPFIVQFPTGCGISCHEAVKAGVGKGHHSILSSTFAQIIVNSDEMITLHSNLDEVIVDYAAMLPSLKVEKETHFISQQDVICTDNTRDLVFQAILHPQDSSDLSTTLMLLEGVVDEISRVISGGKVSLSVNPTGLVANEENIVSFVVSCFEGTSSVISASIVSQLVYDIASMPFVLWVEYREHVIVHNRWAAGLCQSGTVGEYPMFDSGLDGSGMVVGVSDTGIDMSHCQFYDSTVSTPFNTVDMSHRKVVSYITYADNTDDADGHGTHVSSTAAGKSNIRYGDFMKYDGNAREAKIAFVDIGESSGNLKIPDDLISGIFQPLRNAGAKISSHSWGSSSNSYTSNARSVDVFMQNYPDSLVIFAVGNDGIEKGVGSVGSPSTNKNGLSVGASINSYDVMRAIMGPDISSSKYSDDSVAGFSSIGPTGDGRLKPDITAPGWYTVAAEAISGAANDHCDVQTLRGTSMATPAVAGNAILIQQYFTEGFYPSGIKNPSDSFVPSGALIKAMLVHSGVAMESVTYDDGSQASTGGYPSNIQGYGKIRLSNVLNFGESTNNPISLFVVGDTNAASPHFASLSSTDVMDRYYIVAHSEPSPIRVTLTYTDIAGSAGSSNPLVNDLELRVKLNGDIFVPYHNSYSDINNIEMIDIANPCAGCNYTIEVRAVSVSATQPYALVATGVVTEAVLNNTYVGTTINTDESIGPHTFRIIVVLGILCLILGSIVLYLHKCDLPPQENVYQKSFAEEQREQAEALRFYEEQQRQRSRQQEERNRNARRTQGAGRNQREGNTRRPARARRKNKNEQREMNTEMVQQGHTSHV